MGSLPGSSQGSQGSDRLPNLLKVLTVWKKPHQTSNYDMLFPPSSHQTMFHQPPTVGSEKLQTPLQDRASPSESLSLHHRCFLAFKVYPHCRSPGRRNKQNAKNMAPCLCFSFLLCKMGMKVIVRIPQGCTEAQ